ncbi:OLC1v1016278C1 [Oldenlandia corymbosa var. corymbosa]|uniref:OLC1v1016278C1 n=1 Tax=Oldenlandia corymbosa var. corymbosa TaxID=529605 RepID=A0AAV1E5B8_OLDCO|nr:OLC1v1016278C1 [Oldenlandia corymbosa var. corymbosa]
MRVINLQISSEAEALSTKHQSLSLLGYLIDDDTLMASKCRVIFIGTGQCMPECCTMTRISLSSISLCKTDLLVVLDNGPYAVHNGHLILRRWTRDYYALVEVQRIQDGFRITMAEDQRFQPMNIDPPPEVDNDGNDGDVNDNDNGNKDHGNGGGDGNNGGPDNNPGNGEQEDMDLEGGTEDDQPDDPLPGGIQPPFENGFHQAPENSPPSSRDDRGVRLEEQPEEMVGNIVLSPNPIAVGFDDIPDWWRPWGFFCNAQSNNLENEVNQGYSQVKVIVSETMLTEVVDHQEAEYQLEEQASQYFSRILMQGEKINKFEEDIILTWPLSNSTPGNQDQVQTVPSGFLSAGCSSGKRTRWIPHAGSKKLKKMGCQFSSQKREGEDVSATNPAEAWSTNASRSLNSDQLQGPIAQGDSQGKGDFQEALQDMCRCKGARADESKAKEDEDWKWHF